MAKTGNPNDPRTWSDEKLVSEFKDALVKAEKVVYSANYSRCSGPDPRDEMSARASELERILLDRLPERRGRNSLAKLAKESRNP